MGDIAWQNAPMRWPWTGIQEAIAGVQRQLERLEDQHERHKVDYDRLVKEHSRFTTECIMDMRRYSERKDRELDARLDKIDAGLDETIAEQRAQREALLRMIDRLGPAPGTA